MRVVSGKCKGRALKSVPGQMTRPTTDKVKEAVFNMIGPYFSGGLGLDLFSGSGGLGIEGLSRGLEKVIFIDHDNKAIRTIKENLQICALQKEAEVYRNDWQRALKAIMKRNLQFSVVWLDPPYRKEDVYTSILQIFNDHLLIHKDGSIVCEHAKEVELPDQVGSLYRWKLEHYGTIAISIYRLV